MKDLNFEIKKILCNAMVTSLVNPNVVTLLKSEDEIAEEIVKLCNKPAVSNSADVHDKVWRTTTNADRKEEFENYDPC